MNEETKLHDVLRVLAESGAEPDEGAAWTAITEGIAADARRARRTKLAVIAGAVAAGSLAAAIAIFAGVSGDEESVDVGPAATDDSAPASSELPAHTLLAEVRASGGGGEFLDHVPGGAEIHVLDAATGQTVSTPITLSTGEFVFDAVIDRAGTIYYRAGKADFSDVRLRAVSWRGAPQSLPTDLPAEAVSLAIRPDGARLAFAIGSRGEGDASRIGFLDVATGDITYMDWSRDEGGDRRLTGIADLSFSADGDELLFSASRDSLDPIESFVLELDADETLSDARSLGQQVAGVVWGDGGVIGFRNVPTGGALGTDLAYVEEGPAGGLPRLDVEAIDGLASGSGGVYATVLSDDQAEPTFKRLDAGGARWVPFPLPPRGRIIAASP
jgi:hypothetical protein